MLNDNFVKTIEAIDGVTGIKRWYYTDAEYRVNGISEDWIQGFSQDEQSDLEKNLIKGTADYDELIADNGIILLQERADLSGHEYEEMTRQYVDYMPKKLEKASEAYFQEETHSFAAELMKGEFHG